MVERPSAWITTVTHRLAIDLRRAQGRAPEPGLGADDVEPDERQALADFIRRGVPVSDVVDRDAIDRIWQQLRAQLGLARQHQAHADAVKLPHAI